MKTKEITKDEILAIKFPDADVLPSQEKRSDRWLNLKKASYGWNTPSSQKNITFQSKTKGILSVHSEVLKTESKYIILSGGYVIPIRSIYNIQ